VAPGTKGGAGSKKWKSLLIIPQEYKLSNRKQRFDEILFAAFLRN
jgi:hypothetical protein